MQLTNRIMQAIRPEPVKEDNPAHENSVYTPEADIRETSDSYIVDVYMPGVSEKTVEVTLENDALSLWGRVDRTGPSPLNLLHKEYGIGDYQRVFTVSEGIDRDRISAHTKDGVLQVVLPKLESSKPRRIPIQTH